LIGIGGVYNYGCEAQVRGSEIIIHREYPTADIIYASRRPVDDHARLCSSQVKIVERSKLGKYSIKNISRKLLSIIGVKWSPMQDSLQLLNDIDAVFSIGGDRYTLGPTGNYSFSLPKFGDATLRHGLLYVLWGVSVGPFSENSQVEKVFARHLKRLSLITARESVTVNYLKSLGVSDNVVACSDPAFVVAPEIVKDHSYKCNSLTIGINLSPLSSQYSQCSVDESILMQARAIESLIKTHSARIVLIPHVICDFDEGDDDRRYLRRVMQSIAPEYRIDVRLFDMDRGFIDTKRELINCDLIIAARMHCAINALTAHVPTIFLSYSPKALGMSQYVYGNRDWVITLDDFASYNVLEKKVKLMKAQESEIRAYLAKRIPEIQQDAFRPMNRLKLLMECSGSQK
jgi:polysaccharide pyruvyl transferase WcaK-like protein